MSARPDTVANHALRVLDSQRDTLYGVQSVDFEINPRTKLIGEKVRLLVGPWQQLPLEEDSFRKVYDALALPQVPSGVGRIQIGSGWHQARQPGSQTQVEAFSFGSLNYFEDVTERYDPSEPLLRRFLIHEGVSPLAAVTRMSQEREVSFQVYPDAEYVSLMLGYRQSLEMGRDRDKVLDFLTHGITREQFTEGGLNGWYQLRELLIKGEYITPENYLTLQAGQYYHLQPGS